MNLDFKKNKIKLMIQIKVHEKYEQIKRYKNNLIKVKSSKPSWMMFTLNGSKYCQFIESTSHIRFKYPVVNQLVYSNVMYLSFLGSKSS